MGASRDQIIGADCCGSALAPDVIRLRRLMPSTFNVFNARERRSTSRPFDWFCFVWPIFDACSLLAIMPTKRRGKASEMQAVHSAKEQRNLWVHEPSRPVTPPALT